MTTTLHVKLFLNFFNFAAREEAMDGMEPRRFAGKRPAQKDEFGTAAKIRFA
jgi:hypothetical protein